LIDYWLEFVDWNIHIKI